MNTHRKKTKKKKRKEKQTHKKKGKYNNNNKKYVSNFIKKKSKQIKTLFNNNNIKKMLKFFLEDDNTHSNDNNRCMCIDYDINNNDYTMENNQDYRRCKRKVMNDSDYCEKHQNCKGYIKNFMNGYEINYDKKKWDHPYVKGTHNCYSYFLNDIQQKLKDKCDKLCKKKNGVGKCPTFIGKCGDYKPQPGDFDLLMREGSLKSKKRNYTCSDMEKKILSDNKSIKPIPFNEKCPSNFYKGAMVIHDDRTFHFYRNNKDGSWSHKPGTMAVTNLDADKKNILIPHFANRDYSHKPNKIKYNSFCNYYCIPDNSYIKTNSM